MLRSHFTIRARLAVLISVFGIGFPSFALLAYNTLTRAKVNGESYTQIVRGKDLVADVLPPPEYIIESYLNAIETLDETNPAAIAKLIERGNALKNDYEERHAYWARKCLRAISSGCWFRILNDWPAGFSRSETRRFCPPFSPAIRLPLAKCLARR